MPRQSRRRGYERRGAHVHRFTEPTHPLQALPYERLWAVLNRLTRRGWTHRELGRSLGVSKSYVYLLLAGTARNLGDLLSTVRMRA